MPGPYPGLLCAVDFSKRSRIALAYAAALADHFKARLRVLTVAPEEDVARYRGRIHEWLHQFVAGALQGSSLRPAPEVIIRAGEPGDVILQVSAEEPTDLVVMSTHGDGRARGAYGSTAAYVLAHASVPVLVAPLGLPEPPVVAAEALLGSARIILAPVDFHSRAEHDATIAGGLADAFGLPLLLLHVVPAAEPADAVQARAVLDRVADAMRTRVPVEALVAHGNPATEISRIAGERHAGAIVMGLRGDRRRAGSPPGSIAYAVLCEAPALILALPPALEPSTGDRDAEHAGRCVQGP